MELTVTQKRDNALLDRTEVHFTVAHPGTGTPTRAEIRKALTGTLNATDRIVILDWARSEFGRSTTRGYAKVYKTKERALALETPPILIRNGLLAAVKKEEAPKEAPAPPAKKEAPKAEAPREERKEEKKEGPKKGAAPAKEEKKEAKPPAKEERKEGAKREEAAKEKKPAAKKEGK